MTRFGVPTPRRARGVLTALLLLLTACAACGGPSVTVEGEPFRVVHASPTHGAVAVALDVTVAIGFSVPVAESSDQAIVLSRIDTETAGPIDVARFFVDDRHVVELLPRQLLVPGATYEILAGEEVLAEDGTALSAAFRSRFVTSIDEGG